MHNHISYNRNLVCFVWFGLLCFSYRNLRNHFGSDKCYWLLYLGDCEVCLQANQRGKRKYSARGNILFLTSYPCLYVSMYVKTFLKIKLQSLGNMLEHIYKPHYDYQNSSPLAKGTDLNRQTYAILQTH